MPTKKSDNELSPEHRFETVKLNDGKKNKSYAEITTIVGSPRSTVVLLAVINNFSKNKSTQSKPRSCHPNFFYNYEEGARKRKKFIFGTKQCNNF